VAARDGERREPKYATIAADLHHRIAIGEFRPGQALPPQRELSASYGVTLMTLRQALGQLADQGLVSQEAGRGTFVSGPKAAHTMGPLRSLSDDLRAQGHTVDTVVLAREEVALPEWVAERLDRPAGSPGLRVERLRRLGTTPAIHQTSWVPGEFARQVAGVDLSGTSLYDALAAGGTTVVRADERLAPALLEGTLSAMLNRPSGVPVLHSDRTTYAEGDIPVVFDRATILGDLIEVRAVHTRGATASAFPALR
jgi:GntR family transcriptional regulator